MRKKPSFPTLFPLLLLSLVFPPSNSDPDLLLDYCITDTSPTAQSLHFNGLPCLDPALARPSHFATSILSKPDNTAANPWGFNVTLTTTAALPGANAQGLALARINLAGGSLVPPHAHPRASEVALLLRGDLLVGFVDTSHHLFTQRLRAGDAFVFPRGLVHFLYNLDRKEPAVAVSGLNSQNPGAQMMPLAVFRSEPRIPEEVLEETFKIFGQDIQRIQRNLGG